MQTPRSLVLLVFWASFAVGYCAEAIVLSGRVDGGLRRFEILRSFVDRGV